jgi:GrpB-like predicted nucleotidyltransferase (UPF0157 family)
MSYSKVSNMLLQEYQTCWAYEFEQLKNKILAPILNLPVQLEHVGSTSITGLAAKPIIDIDLVFQGQIFNQIKQALESLGYYHAGDQGIKDREVFKRALNPHSDAILDQISHHLYVCPFESIEWRRHVFFRNYLRTNPNMAEVYQALKIAIAEAACQDRKQFALLKETKAKAFFDSIFLNADLDTVLKSRII